jgi:hypothetical protein
VSSVSDVPDVRFKCFNGCCKKIDLDIAYVAMAIHVCCKCLFKMFHLLQTNVASVSSKCCICYGGYTHLLQAYVLNISSASDVCCRKCFHVASVSWVGAGGPVDKVGACVHDGCCKSRSWCRICCNGYTYILQVPIQNVSSTLDICCKCFYLDVAYVVMAIHTYIASICFKCFIC